MRTEHQQQHALDVERIIKVGHAHRLYLGFHEAYAMWCQHSEKYAAGWLSLPEDKEVLAVIERWVAEECSV